MNIGERERWGSLSSLQKRGGRLERYSLPIFQYSFSSISIYTIQVTKCQI
jgi:hypothetical protein